MKNCMMIGNKNYLSDFDINEGQLDVKTLAGYQVLKLNNEHLDNAIEVIPGYGARLNGLWLSDRSVKRNIIEGYESDEDLASDTYYHNAWLFPFVNRLKNGVYEFEGKDYRFPLNEPDKGNALHGFLFNQPFEIQDMGVNTEETFIKLRYSYDGEYDYYPFPFDFQVIYRSNKSNILEVEFFLENTSEHNAPVSFGWHPYLTFSDDIKNIKVTAPIRERVEVNPNIIPTGSSVKDERFLNGKEIQDDQLDNSFRLIPTEKYTVALLSQQDRAEITMEFNKSMKFLQMFTPPTRQSIAIEPVTSNINVFQNGDGLLIIKPGESFSTIIKIMLTQTT